MDNKSDANKGLPIRALHDSGCAKTIISTATFNRLVQQGHISVHHPENKIVIVTCTGEAQPIQGTVDIIFHFQGSNNVNKSYELNVLVHSSLNQDCLLGRDFTGSNAKAFETNDHLYLTEESNSPYDPVKYPTQNQTLCQVPLRANRNSLLRVAACKATVIPPFQIAQIRGHFNKHDNPVAILPVTPKGEMSYEVVNSLIPHATTAAFLMQCVAPNEVYIPLYNSTWEDIYINAHDQIAEVNLISDEIEINHMQMHESVRPEFACNYSNIDLQESNPANNSLDSEDDFLNYLKSGKYPSIPSFPSNNAIPDFIQNDVAMNDDEKEEANLNFIKRGYHHPSMTQEVEQKASLTEMYLKSTVPVKDEDFEDQFDLDHMKPAMKKFALKIFRQNIQAFSKHACDIGKAKHIEMDIPLLTDQPHVQKYIPIPHAIRPQVRAVLDQMLEFGLIRECDEPSLFCSNLLVVKKKDGTSIRILLDGRLLNHYMQRLPTNLVTHPELYAHLVGKTHVTVMDLSDSFFQMMLKRECQALTAFYSEAHGKRYCFTRVPQGLKNSPLHLKLLMDSLFGDMALDVIHYADDIMVATNGSLKDHIIKVGEVLAKLKGGNIKIRPQKIQVAKETVEFLGVVWKKRYNFYTQS